MRRILPLLLAATFAVAQKYEGTRPPKPDVVYLKHAAELIPTEAVTAKEETKKDDHIFVIAGANSPVVTPLASPIFIVEGDKLNPETLALFRLESKDGRRQIVETSKKPLTPLRVEMTRYNDRIWKIEVDDSLEPGEYSFSPRDSNQTFCFRVR